MRKYKGIEFAKGYNRSFAEFKKEFASTHVFRSIHPDKREAELKKAWKIATKKDADGNTPTAGERKKAKQGQDK